MHIQAVDFISWIARRKYLKLSRDQASLIIEAKLALSNVYSFESRDARQNSLQYTRS